MRLHESYRVDEISSVYRIYSAALRVLRAINSIEKYRLIAKIDMHFIYVKQTQEMVD